MHSREKEVVDLDSLTSRVEVQLQEIQAGLFKKALKFRSAHITRVDSFEEFKAVLNQKTGYLEIPVEVSYKLYQQLYLFHLWNFLKSTFSCFRKDTTSDAFRTEFLKV